jgi:hypothetical protein
MSLEGKTGKEYALSGALAEAGVQALHLLRGDRCLFFAGSDAFLSKRRGQTMGGRRLQAEHSVVFKHLDPAQLCSAVNLHSQAAATEEVLWTYQARLLLWTTIDLGTASISHERVLADADKVCFAQFLKQDFVVVGLREAGKSFVKVYQVSRHREKGVAFKEKALYEYAADLDRVVSIDEKLCLLRNDQGLLSLCAIKHLLAKQPEVPARDPVRRGPAPQSPEHRGRGSRRRSSRGVDRRRLRPGHSLRNFGRQTAAEAGKSANRQRRGPESRGFEQPVSGDRGKGAGRAADAEAVRVREPTPAPVRRPGRVRGCRRQALPEPVRPLVPSGRARLSSRASGRGARGAEGFPLGRAQLRAAGQRFGSFVER